MPATPWRLPQGSGRGHGPLLHDLLHAPAAVSGRGHGPLYLILCTRTLQPQPCTDISQLPRIIGLIVTPGLVNSPAL